MWLFFLFVAIAIVVIIVIRYDSKLFVFNLVPNDPTIRLIIDSKVFLAIDKFVLNVTLFLQIAFTATCVVAHIGGFVVTGVAVWLSFFLQLFNA